MQSLVLCWRSPRRPLPTFDRSRYARPSGVAHGAYVPLKALQKKFGFELDRYGFSCEGTVEQGVIMSFIAKQSLGTEDSREKRNSMIASEAVILWAPRLFPGE